MVDDYFSRLPTTLHYKHLSDQHQPRVRCQRKANNVRPRFEFVALILLACVFRLLIHVALYMTYGHSLWCLLPVLATEHVRF